MAGGVPVNKHIQIKISTKNTWFFGSYNDAPTAVDLVRCTTQDKEGWFWSDSQMLVSNTVDDEDVPGTSTYLNGDEEGPGGDALGPKNGYTWKLSDRTHKVALGGRAKAEYEANGLTVSASAPVKVVKTVKLNIHVMLDQAGGAPVETKANALAHITKMREIFAQVGIGVAYTLHYGETPPEGVVLTNGLNLTLGGAGLSNEEKQLLADGAMATRSNPVDEQTGRRQIELYYISYCEMAGIQLDLKGYALCLGGPWPARYADSALVVKNAHHFVMAHEVGHILEVVLEGNHHYPYTPLPNTDPLDTVNLMVGGSRPVANNTVFESRRLNNDQKQRMLTRRSQLLT